MSGDSDETPGSAAAASRWVNRTPATAPASSTVTTAATAAVVAAVLSPRPAMTDFMAAPYSESDVWPGNLPGVVGQLGEYAVEPGRVRGAGVGQKGPLDLPEAVDQVAAGHARDPQEQLPEKRQQRQVEALAVAAGDHHLHPQRRAGLDQPHHPPEGVLVEPGREVGDQQQPVATLAVVERVERSVGN